MEPLRWMVLLVGYIMSGFPLDCAGQRYAIVAPRIVRPHSEYEVMVTNVAAEAQRFRYDIKDASNAVVRTRTAQVEPHKIEKVSLRIDSLEEGNYRLQVWDVLKDQLVNSTDLSYSSKSFVVLFQTDKPVYKPGDTVQFRVLFLLPNSKPVRSNVKPSVFITDASRYRMKQWTNATLQNGVFEGSFQLAQYTALGSWSISALVNEQHYTDSFNVQEYVLPLFKIGINSVPNSYFHCEDPDLVLKVSATYMGGGPVRGTATVVVRANYNNYPSQTKEVGRQQLTIDGSTRLRFPTSIVAETCDEERNVWFDVSVREGLSGVTYNATGVFTVQNLLYNMERLGETEAFFPGVPMQLRVRLASADGKPAPNEIMSVRYKVQREGHEMDTIIPEYQRVTTSSKGIVTVKINSTKDTVSIHVEGVYKNHSFPLLFARPFYEDNNVEYITAHTRQAYYNTTGKISINLYSNVNTKRIFYVGYCQQAVCTSGVHESVDAAKFHNLIIPALESIPPPRMNLLVFTVKEDGTIISTPIIIRFRPVDQSLFKVTVAVDEERRGKLDLTVSAEKDAFVGLLGVDQRIALRPSALNDITLSKLENAIQSQDDSMGLWYAYDTFGSLGVTLLTDGQLPDVGYVPQSIDDYARSSLDDDDENVRTDFPETWIWESFVAKNGIGTVEKRLPSSITSWRVTGFSVGQKHGLQILSEPVRIRKQKNVYAQLHVPAAIKRFEEITAHCFIHNNGKAINVTVDVSPELGRFQLLLEQGTTKSVPFTLHSDRVGELSLEVVVKNLRGAVIDALRQTVLVRPDGVVKVVEDIRLVNFAHYNQSTFTLSLSPLAEKSVESSGEVTFSAIGTLFNFNQFDLERMVFASHGTGEENLLYLQTTLAVYEYLSKARQLSKGRQAKFVGYMEVAYQHQLRFRLKEGSFSLFGTRHKCGSIWLTASTVETLFKLSAYLPVDETVIAGALSWLAAQRQHDGTFNESCPIVQPHIERTGGKELSLASDVMLAFVGNKFSDQYSRLINDTMSLLAREPNENVHVLAKTAYLFGLLEHPAGGRMLDSLNKLAVKDGLFTYWRVASGTKGLSQEATAYGLLANLKGTRTLDENELLRVAQWIQQSCFTTDLHITSVHKIVALRALQALADHLPAVAPNMIVNVGMKSIRVEASNKNLLQTFTLQNVTRRVEVSVKGTGLTLVTLGYRYILPAGGPSKPIVSRRSVGSVEVDITKPKEKRPQQTTWNICVTYGVYWYRAFLAKVIIILPTGYHFVRQPAIAQDNRTRSAISLEDDTHLELIHYITENGRICYPLRAATHFTSLPVSSGTVSTSPFDARDEFAVFPLL